MVLVETLLQTSGPILLPMPLWMPWIRIQFRTQFKVLEGPWVNSISNKYTKNIPLRRMLHRKTWYPVTITGKRILDTSKITSKMEWIRSISIHKTGIILTELRKTAIGTHSTELPTAPMWLGQPKLLTEWTAIRTHFKDPNIQMLAWVQAEGFNLKAIWEDWPWDPISLEPLPLVAEQ